MPANVNIWPVPIALGILTCIGLIAALVADGFWDAVSWVGLGTPLAVAAWFAWLKPLRGRRNQ